MKDRFSHTFFWILGLVLLASCLTVPVSDPETIGECLLLGGFAPVLWPSGSSNMGGYKGRVAFIPESAVSKVPALPESPSEAADYVTAAGSFTFINSGDKPTPIYATRATVSYKADIQGETDCKSYKITGEFFHPGNGIEAAAFARQICNTPGYLLIENNDHQLLIGQDGLPCTVSASFDGGKAPADKRGYSFTFEADSESPMIVMGTPIDIAALMSGGSGGA
jgi:hypothetical protein